jgi:hypothetical protein
MSDTNQSEFILKIQGQIIRKQKEIIKNWTNWDFLKMQQAEQFIKKKRKLIQFAKSGRLQALNNKSN